MRKHFHFVGIGGIGVGAIASLVLGQGHTVSGSDLNENQITAQLKDKGVEVFVGHHAENIKGADIVVFSSAISDENAELKAAREKGIPVIRRAELLADLMKDQISVTIAGAHGKTTTSSMIANLFIHADLNPTTAVGGIVNDISSNAQLGSGNYFVAEVDESDGSFLHFTPKFSVITNIDKEHLDYYKNWDNIIDAYAKFINNTTIDGVIFGYGDDMPLLNLLKQGNRTFKTYGFLKHNDVYADNIEYGDFYSRFDCISDGQCLGRVELNVPGKHNIANALGCISLGLLIAIDFKTICESLRAYKGVQRRFQLVDKIENIAIVDDYAHHPTEIKTTLETAQHVKRENLITVFQPHRYSRLESLMDEFAQSLTNCDFLILTDIYAASEQPIKGVSAEVLCEQIRKLSPKPVFYLKKDNLVDNLLNLLNPGDMLITLGAGDITHLGYELSKSLQRIYSHSLISTESEEV